MYALLAVLVAVAVVVPTASWASHTFTDVDDDNTFHDDIDWLAGTGITKGCNPPANDEFCPDDVVTRETLAAFLRRLSENRVVDAGELGGFSSADLGSRAAFVQERYSYPTQVGVDEVYASTTIDAPADGILIIDGVLEMRSEFLGRGDCGVGIDGILGGVHTGGQWTVDPSYNLTDYCRPSQTVVVPKGTHEIRLIGACMTRSVSGVCPLVQSATITAHWVPFDSNGDVPTP